MSANPIGLIVIGIVAVIGVLALFIAYWDDIKAAIVSFAQFVWKISPFKFIIDLIENIFPGFKEGVKNIFGSVIEWVGKMWDGIKGVWNSITSFFGFGDTKAEITVKKEEEDEEDALETEIIKANKTIIPTTNTPTGTTNPANGIDGGGSGAGRSITMNLEIKNYFNMQAGNWREKADEIVDVVVGKINDRMRDSVIALD
jgi:hypothetical protein